MATEEEELQAKEFLKRAEVRTMRKDLMALREGDALKERDKIAKIRTLEEQKEELAKKLRAKEAVENVAELAEMEEVLQKNEGQERLAEEDLKAYATEEERQQIFLLETEQFGFEKQIDLIDEQKQPALKLEENKLLLQRREQQAKLNPILEQEKILEGEQKVVASKERTTNIPSERKSLEQERWDIDKKIQDIEKGRWEIEKQMEDIDVKINQINQSSEKLEEEKNSLRGKILGIDKSLRDIYSVVMEREEEKRKGKAQYQINQRKALSKVRTEHKETIQRQQWNRNASAIPVPVKPVEKRLKKLFDATAEEEQRKKFLQDVATAGEPRQGREQATVDNKNIKN